MNSTPEQYAGKKNSGIIQDPGFLLIVIYVAVIIVLLVLGNIATATANEVDGWRKDLDKVRQGELLAGDISSGRLVPAPLLRQKVDIAVTGMVVTTRVTQRFENTGNEWIEAVYVFPLADESAVTHLRMVIGERIILGEIKEKDMAREMYEKAKSEGRKTSLLAQKRPNIFTMAVANIPPRATIDVEIDYLDTVLYKDNTFSLRFPMVIGPRYFPGKPLAHQTGNRIFFDEGGWAENTDQVTDALQVSPPVIPPGESPVNPVELTLSLTAGFPIKGLTSLYHGVTISGENGGTFLISFDGRVFADRDFVLEYQPANGREIAAALFSEQRHADEYMFLMLMPPSTKLENSLAREVIFVLDTSGSMAGTSMLQAKSALQYAVSRLHPRDHFNIILFNHQARKFFPAALPASRENLSRAEKSIAAIDADGGTEIASALELALDGRRDHHRIRQVVLLTDGAVGNESDLLSMINSRLADSRLFTVGIGSAPNAYFMNRAARMGRGTFSFIGKTEEVETVMRGLFAKLENPVLTGMQIEAEAGTTIEVFPTPLPDLYDGEPVVALIKTKNPLVGLHLKGYRQGKAWEVSVAADRGKKRSGIATLWARKKIRSLMDSLNSGAEEAEVRKEVTATALEHHLVSRYTSLVAIEQERERPPSAELTTRQMGTNLPQGWQHDKVFGTAARTGTASQLMLFAGAILLFVSLMMLRKRRRQ